MVNSRSRNLGIIGAIVAVATSLSVVSYQYSQYSAAQIEEISINDVQSNAEIQAFDLSNSLADKLEDITSILQVIAASRSVHEEDLDRAASILNEAQLATSELVDFYMWLDKDGGIVWISNINQTFYNEYRGLDLSYRLYFSEPKASHEVYYSSIVDSNDRINRLYVSYPIIQRDGFEQNDADSPHAKFSGAVIAAIRTDILGNYLEDQISPRLDGQVSLTDNRGIILYSRDDAFVGRNVFGVRYQSHLQSLGPAASKTMSTGLQLGLQGHFGSEEISSNNDKSTFVYSPIVLEGKQFGLLFLTVPYTEVAEVTALVESQKNLSMLIILSIGASAVISAVVIMRWNKELEKMISRRTIELREANKQLQVHDKLQREFINIAAHELRTPIQPIIGISEMLAMNPEEDREEIRILVRNAQRLERLTQDILDVSKIESGSLTLNKQEVPLDDIISPIVIDLGQNKKNSVLPSDGIGPRVKIRYEPSNLVVKADKEKIQQVISNLIRNALKFTEEGEVLVTSSAVDGFAQVTIKDTGSGIDSEILPRLFQKFATKSEKGTGLGLFISKNIVEAHGGKIWAQNNGDQRGATFGFTLPLA